MGLLTLEWKKNPDDLSFERQMVSSSYKQDVCAVERVLPQVQHGNFISDKIKYSQNRCVRAMVVR